MGEHDRPQRSQGPDLSSDAAMDRLLRRLGPLLRWQEHEDRGAPEEERSQPDPAFARRLRAQLLEEEAPPSARQGRPARGHAALRVGLAAATVAVMILVAVAVVEVGVVTAITAALALVVVAAVLVVRARLGQ